ncbi:MAG TPA: hypothetical protein VGP45_10360, partial [Marinobacter sp.]|nr:hypothetical protein [Marinobacter sp.]
ETDNALGRIIALALPANHGLPELKKSTHATDLDNETIQEMLRSLTQSKVGVFGATLKADLQSHSWIAATTKLVRWAVMMLPIDGPTQITFKIENRGGYQGSTSLRALEENLTDELRQLAPERFRELRLSLELVTKDTPYNGYVDVIANCWGSPNDTKRRLLARTGWRGHCLLQSTDLADIDRLYQGAGSEPDTDTWFAICTHLAREPGHSLFHDLLTQLGERVQNDGTVWQRYLDAMRQRIALKTFDAGSLGRALQWLKRYQPASERLPGLIELQLASAELASANHLGHSNVQQVARVMTLARELRDESAPDACEAALRVAISATNGFDFESVVPFIEDWIAQPIAVPGRLNHGKLHSTLGQLCAFRADYDSALRHFDEATEHFDQLSDPLLANRNGQQTSSYRAIVQLDMKSTAAPDAVRQLTQRATKKTGTHNIRQLARSTSPFRFEHYLLLRWLVSSPDETKARQDYLACRDEWQVGEGHPWMLINAYRAWLLVDEGDKDNAAGYLQQSLEDCAEAEDSAILHWMAHCLHALGESLGLTVEPPARPCPAAPFPSEHLASLRTAGAQEDRMHALNRLLPFNFH